ncbi:MAG: [LysW]-lysine hydrolase [Phycisphaerales bacterium]|nr:[LysW]-lysine hydrolase [Phycisphaerales bacterium]
MNDESAVQLLHSMLEVQSLSGRETELARFLVARAESVGLRAEIDSAGNFIAATAGDPLRSGPAHRDIVLLGHMDTVPGRIPVRIEHGRLHGRGAVDAKGPLAAFVAAAARARLPDAWRLVVIGAVEEETPTSRGARAVIGRYRPEVCIIGEPSGWDGVTIGYKGRLVAHFSLRRAVGHSAGPHGSVADAALAWWARARAAAIKLAPEEGGPFGRVQATVRGIETTSDGLLDRAEMTVGFRLPPGVAPGSLREICDDVARAEAPDAELRFEGGETAVVTDRAAAPARALTAAIRAAGARPRLVLKTGTSDMNVVGPAWGCPIVAYGPGDSALDHTPGEHIVVSEYLAAIGVLGSAISGLTVVPGPAGAEAGVESPGCAPAGRSG